MKLAPSILAADLADLRSVVREAGEAGCDLVHFDVMDGHFVPNLTFGPPLVRCVRKHSGLPFDVHLMVSEPGQYIADLAGLGVEILSFHIEATHCAPRLCQQIRQCGMRPAVALNPQTPLSAIELVLPLIDVVLVMTVDPGYAGQAFVEPCWDKLAQLAALRQTRGVPFEIEVDGGINAENIARLCQLGVDIVVAGKAFFAAESKSGFVNLAHSA